MPDKEVNVKVNVFGNIQSKGKGGFAGDVSYGSSAGGTTEKLTTPTQFANKINQISDITAPNMLMRFANAVLYNPSVLGKALVAVTGIVFGGFIGHMLGQKLSSAIGNLLNLPEAESNTWQAGLSIGGALLGAAVGGSVGGVMGALGGATIGAAAGATFGGLIDQASAGGPVDLAGDIQKQAEEVKKTFADLALEIQTNFPELQVKTSADVTGAQADINTLNFDNVSGKVSGLVDLLTQSYRKEGTAVDGNLIQPYTTFKELLLEIIGYMDKIDTHNTGKGDSTSSGTFVKSSSSPPAPLEVPKGAKITYNTPQPGWDSTISFLQERLDRANRIADAAAANAASNAAAQSGAIPSFSQLTGPTA